MSQIPTSFTEAGARRIVAVVKDVESIDLRGGGAKRRAKGNGTGPHSFVIGRVTEVDSSDPLLVSVKEQYWADGEEGAAGDFAEVVGGRVWDTASDTLPQVRCVDGQPRAVDALVTLGHKFGPDNASQWFVVPEKAGWFHAKITASSSGSEDHTFVEIDADDAELTGGRTATDAKAMNARKGVPVDTYTIVFDLGPTEVDGDPVYKFIVTDGLTDSPKDLTSTATTASATTWNVEEDSEAVTYDASRTALAAETVYFFDRQFIADASGFTIDITAERASFITADSADSAKLSHITMVDFTNAGVDGKLIRLNQAQDDHNTLIFSPGTGIELNAGTADVEVEVDDSGRLLLANGGSDVTITISATGGGSADGQGYEDVEVNGASILAITNGGVINFQDKASVTSGHAQVQFNGANNTPEVTIEAEVDIDAYLKSLAGYVGGNNQVLTHTAAAVMTWVDTAECP